MINLKEYNQKIINFVKSIFIYFPDLAYTINKYNELHGDLKTVNDINWPTYQLNSLKQQYLPDIVMTDDDGSVVSDKKQWKYYRNLAGKPYTGYVLGTSEINAFTSNSTITLNGNNITLANLKQDPNLLKRFKYNFQYLLQKYPNDTLYLKGLLNPLSYEELINKKQGQIIYYDKSFLEYNEDYIIYEIQNYIYNVIDAWYNRDYILVDNLYLSGFINTLYSMLPAKIMNLKISKIYTTEIDSFNLNNYFIENYDNSLKTLSNKTRMWLYWNTNLLHNKRGENYAVDLVNENVLNPLGLILKRKILYKSKLQPIENTTEKLLYLPQFKNQANVAEYVPYDNDNSELIDIENDSSDLIINNNRKDTFEYTLKQSKETYRILNFNDIWNITLSYLAFEFYKYPSKLYNIDNNILTGGDLIVTLINILDNYLGIKNKFNFIPFHYTTLYLLNNPSLPDILIKKFNIVSDNIKYFLNYFKTEFFKPNANQLELSFLLESFFKIVRNNLTDAQSISQFNNLMESIRLNRNSALNILNNQNMDNGLILNKKENIGLKIDSKTKNIIGYESFTAEEWMIRLGLQDLMYLRITDLITIINKTFNVNIDWVNLDEQYAELKSILNKIIPYNIEIDIQNIKQSFIQVSNNLTSKQAHTKLRNINNAYVRNYTVYGLEETPVLANVFKEHYWFNETVVNNTSDRLYDKQVPIINYTGSMSVVERVNNVEVNNSFNYDIIGI